MSAGGSHYIGGRWVGGIGAEFVSTSPVVVEDLSGVHSGVGRSEEEGASASLTGASRYSNNLKNMRIRGAAAVWAGHAATAGEVEAAVAAAREVAGAWAAAAHGDRVTLVQAVGEQYRGRRDELAAAISADTGKPPWEARSEVDAMIAKVAISVEACERRTTRAGDASGAGNAPPGDGVTLATRYKPHGVVAVLGPFNMPGHLPNGHLIPAVLAGNAAVFKPSERAPRVAEVMAEAWHAAGAPAGVFNLVQGGAQTGIDLASHPGIDGLFFTGSYAVGLALSRMFAERPGAVLALEMGGNNPLVVHDCADLDAAAYLAILSAYITAGQRCSCARRLIVPSGPQGDAFVERLVNMIGRIRAGLPDDDPEPFMGPVISAPAAEKLLQAQARLVERGGRTIVEMKASPRSPALLSPGLIDVTAVAQREDEELFGPILQLIRVPDFDAAIREANDTRYGLTAGLLSDRRDLYDRFYRDVRAGVVNWNRQLTGSSSRLPFGGVGRSGNHRPSAYIAAGYCANPVAAMESERVVMPKQLSPGISP
jgi:succinylglutamic semialdehyde dehydrogenase